MKALLVVLILAVTGSASDISCTTLYHHGQRDITLCRVTDGEITIFTKTEVSSSGAEELTISKKSYKLLMERDMAEEREHTDQVEAATARRVKALEAITAKVDAEVSASAISSKKHCKASGFIWVKGNCTLKDNQ